MKEKMKAILHRFLEVIFRTVSLLVDVIFSAINYILIALSVIIWAPIEVVGIILEYTVFDALLYIFTGVRRAELIDKINDASDRYNKPLFLTSYPLTFFLEFNDSVTCFINELTHRISKIPNKFK